MDEKQRKAISFYLKGYTEHNACVAAGYSKTSKSTQVFGRDDVKKEIVRRQKIMSTKSDVDASWIIERLKAIADAQLADIIVFDEEGIGRIDFTKLTPELRRALNGYQVKPNGEMSIKVADQLRALEMLARHLGMFDDKLSVAGEMTLVERLQKGRERAQGTTDAKFETGHTSESTT